jgi:4'-phosphopantetheinyl transferase
MLRLGLSWYLGNNPREVALTTGLRGKPRQAEASPLHFNVTHRDCLALIAFTTIGEVDIDVEAVDRRVESLDIANSNFTRKEAEAIAVAGSLEEQRKHFLRFWTRKEAVLKAAGGGLLYGLDSVDVSGEPPGGRSRRGRGIALAGEGFSWNRRVSRCDCGGSRRLENGGAADRLRRSGGSLATHFPGLW